MQTIPPLPLFLYQSLQIRAVLTRCARLTLCRCAQQYFSYSLIILGITLFSVLTSVISTYRYRRRLAALAHYTCEVQVLQGGRLNTVQSTELLPGAVQGSQ